MIGRNAAGALFTAAQRSEVFDPPHSQMLLVLGIGDVVDFDRLLDRAGLIGRVDFANPQGRRAAKADYAPPKQLRRNRACTL